MKQQPSMLPGPAVHGCYLVSFRFLCDIHSIYSEVILYSPSQFDAHLAKQSAIVALLVSAQKVAEMPQPPRRPFLYCFLEKTPPSFGSILKRRN